MERVTSADGTRIAYDESGSGPPLVLVHGTSADRTRWEPVRPGFDAAFTVYAMDRRGRGDSGDGDEYDLAREVEDVVAVVESVEAPATLLGHSFGALCALEAALQTDRVELLVLYEPALQVDGRLDYAESVQAEMEALLEDGENERALETFFRGIANFSEAELDALRSVPNWPARVAAAHTTLRETRVDEAYRFDPARFEDLRTPTLLLSGSESAAFLRDATAAVAAALPDSQLVVLEGHGHVAQNTAPKWFVDEVVAFAREHR